MTTLEVGQYKFFVEENKLFCLFSDGALIELTKVSMEYIGIQTERQNNKWILSILTTLAIQKVKYQKADKLELISFEFGDLKSAISAQTFILLKLQEIYGGASDN